jgi:hypothetical protein
MRSLKIEFAQGKSRRQLFIETQRNVHRDFLNWAREKWESGWAGLRGIEIPAMKSLPWQ